MERPPAVPPPESAALIRALAAHPEQMADLIEALHRRAGNADALLDLMGRVAREAVRLLPGVGWAEITAQFDGPPLTATSTDARVLVVDERQYAAGDGPCLLAMRTGRTVAVTSEQIWARWPHLASAAEQVGVRSFLAVPLALALGLPFPIRTHPWSHRTAAADRGRRVQL